MLEIGLIAHEAPDLLDEVDDEVDGGHPSQTGPEHSKVLAQKV
jgi:hypothetical protein